MRHLIRTLAILFFLSGLAFGQCDETCNAGDIIWVKDTVAANQRYDGAGTGSCYNDFNAPFGLEAAAIGTDNNGAVCDNVIVRVVLGADNYGPASASWAGRSDASNRISFSFSASSASRLPWEGYIDETTPCTQWDVGGCPITIDFDTNTSNGLQLNGGGTVSSRLVFQWIRVINALGAGVSNPGLTSFFNFESSHNGSHGIEVVQTSSDVSFSRFTGNGGAGFTDGCGGSRSYFGYNRIYNNGTLGAQVGDSVAAWNLVYGNGSDGFSACQSESTFLHNVVDSNVGDGIEIPGTINGARVIGNILTNNGAIGLNISAGNSSIGIIQQNNYAGNTTPSAISGGSTIRVNVDGITASGDVSVCPFVNPNADLSLVSGCNFSFQFPPEEGGILTTTTSDLLKGAAQSSGASSGGANVAF